MVDTATGRSLFQYRDARPVIASPPAMDADKQEGPREIPHAYTERTLSVG